MSDIVETRAPTGRRTAAQRDSELLPEVALPTAPQTSRIWRRSLIFVYVAVALLLLDRLAGLLMNFWLLDELGFRRVFTTNFGMGLRLFAVGFVLLAAAVVGPALANGVRAGVRRGFIHAGFLVALIGGLLFAATYKNFLLFFNSVPWGRTDPVFNLDVSFFTFRLPAINEMLLLALFVSIIAIISSIVSARIALADVRPPEGFGRVRTAIGRVMTPATLGSFGALVAVLILRLWFERYGLLLKSNVNPEVGPKPPGDLVSNVPIGAEYLDVTGFFSTLNGITVEMVAFAAMGVAMIIKFWQLHSATTGRGRPINWRRRLALASFLLALAPGITTDFGFKGLIWVRDLTQVSPNEPVIQLPYIKRHVDATNAAWGLDNVEKTPFRPNGPDDPPADVEKLLASPVIKNAPLWPGYAAWLERVLDPEYVDRVFLTEEPDTSVYTTSLDAFNQQQQLRPYYGVMDIDWVRYNIDGEDRLFASATREIPLLEPQPWLVWWGQRFILFTHGHGLIMAPTAQTDGQGNPVYASKSIPAKVAHPSLGVQNERVYYGEGTNTAAYSGLTGVDEFDRTSDQGGEQFRYPTDEGTGVKVDSFIKRLALGWKTRQFFEIAFSRLITADTQAHYARTPLDRVNQVAPSIYFDTDPYAVAAGKNIEWMLNGIAHTDKYPYSMPIEMGDKSVRRTTQVSVRDPVTANYGTDAVKATLNAFTGELKFYKWADEPMINAWDRIYPGLFTPKTQMPPKVREQVQYSPQFFHAQFDDLYITYHMRDPLTFFNLEDPLDDGDEVVGAIIDPGKSITFSIEPYYWIAEAGKGGLPPASDPSQFSMSLIFTPDGSLNLRAIATVYQDGEDYGKISVLSIPKGEFFFGPEQADAAIDQDAFISQQIALWNRQGLEVIRGHTTPLIVENELLYVEPLFVRSQQNPVPQLKRVVVVYRGRAGLGETLEEALRSAITPPERFPVRPGPELGGEPGFVRSGAGFDERPREGGFTTTVPRDTSQQSK